MSHLIIRSRRTQEIQDFVKNNDPSSLDTSPGQSLKAFQQSHGGSGNTFGELERSWLAAQGYSTIDAYLLFLGYSYGIIRERIRQFLASILSTGTSYYLLEDGTSKYQLEDGSGFYILE